jgi:hypothetical protein
MLMGAFCPSGSQYLLDSVSWQRIEENHTKDNREDDKAQLDKATSVSTEEDLRKAERVEEVEE